MLLSVELWLSLVFIRSLLYSRTGFIVDIIVLILGLIYISKNYLVFQIGLNWLWLPAYLILGLFVFFLSIWMTTTNFRVYIYVLINAIKAQNLMVNTQILFWALCIAIHEEIIWRVVFQSVISDGAGEYFAVIFIAAVFTFWHRSMWADSHAKLFELFTFSLVLGTSFLITGDPLLIIVIHLLRDYFILLGSFGKDA